MAAVKAFVGMMPPPASPPSPLAPPRYTAYEGRACSGRNEVGVWASGFNVSTCQEICDANSACVSFEWHHGPTYEGLTQCQASTSCTLAVSTQHTDITLYVKMMPPPPSPPPLAPPFTPPPQLTSCVDAPASDLYEFTLSSQAFTTYCDIVNGHAFIKLISWHQYYNMGGVQGDASSSTTGAVGTMSAMVGTIVGTPGLQKVSDAAINAIRGATEATPGVSGRLLRIKSSVTSAYAYVQIGPVATTQWKDNERFFGLGGSNLQGYQSASGSAVTGSLASLNFGGTIMDFHNTGVCDDVASCDGPSRYLMAQGAFDCFHGAGSDGAHPRRCFSQGIPSYSPMSHVEIFLHQGPAVSS